MSTAPETAPEVPSAPMTAFQIAAAGITYPPIDELLTRTSSKYGLSIFAAKRARQINDYYAQLGEGLLEYVGPLVHRASRDQRGSAGAHRRGMNPSTARPDQRDSAAQARPAGRESTAHGGHSRAR